MNLPLPTDGCIGDDKVAIRVSNVRKEYRLYDSFTSQALDVLGMSWLRFWKRPEYSIFSALDGIDLEVLRGERIGIVGRNGAGKTTLLKLITGNFAPTDGEIEVNGNVQALMQTGLGFHGEFTGMENIKSALTYSGLPSDEFDSAIEDIVEFCELGDFLQQPIKSYSLGMRARLQFAVSTAIKPDIVIVDEVLGAGDAYFAGKSAARIKRLTDSGATLLIVSHSMQQILQFSTKAIWIEKGKVMHSGEPLEVVNLYEEFINAMEEKSNQGGGNQVSIPKWIQDKLYVGKKNGANWGGGGPLHIERIDVIKADSEVTQSLETRESFGFRAHISSYFPGKFDCSCLFVIYDETGDIVGRVVEPQRTYDIGKADQVIECWIAHNPLGQGKYILSAGLYRDFDVAAPAKGYRYHVLSRGCAFSVNSPERNNCKITMLPEWQYRILKQENDG